MFYSKNRKKYALFLIASGIGALFLTFIYNQSASGYHVIPPRYLTNAKNFSIPFYYLINSLMLILSGMLLYFRQMKSHVATSLILTISVTSSFFLINGFSIPLFIHTVILGFFMGIPVGGFILVPIFLISVYLTAYRIIKYFIVSLKRKEKTIS